MQKSQTSEITNFLLDATSSVHIQISDDNKIDIRTILVNKMVGSILTMFRRSSILVFYIRIRRRGIR
jgi:hypothetical protein